MMSAQVIIAVDEPNVRLTLQEFDPSGRFDYERLLNWCQTDAASRLSDRNPRLKAKVFKPIKLHREAEGFRRSLESMGWETFFKPGTPPSPELFRMNNGLRKLLGSVVKPLVGSAVPDQAQLEEVVEEYIEMYGQKLLRLDYCRLRLSLKILHYRLVRRYVHSILVSLQDCTVSFREETYRQAILETSQNLLAAYPQLTSEYSLSEAYAPNLIWSSAVRLSRDVAAIQDFSHRQWDIDADLMNWVIQEIKPDGINGDADTPAVVYLVGSDWKNYLTLAERLVRYGAIPVLVTYEAKYRQMNPNTRKEASVYPLVFIEDLGCTGRTPCIA